MDRNAKTRGMELIAASFHLFSCRSAPGCVQVTPRSPVVDAVRLTADRTVSISSTAGEKCKSYEYWRFSFKSRLPLNTGCKIFRLGLHVCKFPFTFSHCGKTIFMKCQSLISEEHKQQQQQQQQQKQFVVCCICLETG